MHTIPMLEDDDFCIWEGRTISRYICNKHKLESFYPTDAQKRGLCDVALDFQMGSVYPNVSRVLYPVVGFTGPVSDEQKKADEEAWKNDVWPAFEKLMKLSGGPLLGGEKPSIADLHMLMVLVTCAKCPDSHVAKTEACLAYCK